MKLRTKYISLILILSVSALVFNDCRSDKYIPGLCFQNDILPIFVTKCSMPGCHSGGKKSEGYNLTSYEGIMKGITPRHPLRSPIYNQIRGSHPSMPPSDYPQLTATEKDKIKSWINFGAVNSTNCNTSCDTTQFTYSGQVAPLMSTWCVGCHSSSNPSGTYDLSNYSGVVNAVTKNVLIGSVTYSPGLVPMPQNTSKLSDCNIKILQKWVNAGYPNN